MDSIIINDSMIKESKIWKIPMIIFYLLAALFPLALIFNDIKTSEFILGEVFFILIGSYFLYGYLYACRYKVLVTNEKIVLKTLFKSVEIQFKDIRNYNCKRYRKSEFYQFLVFCKEKRILINTRYKDDLEVLLKNKTIIK